MNFLAPLVVLVVLASVSVHAGPEDRVIKSLGRALRKLDKPNITAESLWAAKLDDGSVAGFTPNKKIFIQPADRSREQAFEMDLPSGYGPDPRPEIKFSSQLVGPGKREFVLEFERIVESGALIEKVKLELDELTGVIQAADVQYLTPKRKEVYTYFIMDETTRGEPDGLYRVIFKEGSRPMTRHLQVDGSSRLTSVPSVGVKPSDYGKVELEFENDGLLFKQTVNVREGEGPIRIKIPEGGGSAPTTPPRSVR